MPNWPRYGPLDYQHSLEQAEAQHAQAQAQRAQAQAQRAQAQAELARARANLNTAQVDYVRTTNLFQSASLVKQQYDEAKGRYEADSAAVTAAEEGVKAAEDGIKAAENGVANAAAAVKEAKLSLRDTTLNAPFAGWISARNVDRGSLVRRQDHRLHHRGYASGQSGLCSTRFQAFGHSPGAEAVRAAGAASPHRGRSGHFDLPAGRSAEPRVHDRSDAGQSARGHQARHDRIPDPGPDRRFEAAGSSCLSPLWCARPADPNGFAVFRLTERDGKSYASAQTIEIGETYGDSIEVTRGLSAGQKIITLGGALVHDGQPVSVIP